MCALVASRTNTRPLAILELTNTWCTPGEPRLYSDEQLPQPTKERRDTDESFAVGMATSRRSARRGLMFDVLMADPGWEREGERVGERWRKPVSSGTAAWAVRCFVAVTFSSCLLLRWSWFRGAVLNFRPFAQHLGWCCRSSSGRRVDELGPPPEQFVCFQCVHCRTNSSGPRGYWHSTHWCWVSASSLLFTVNRGLLSQLRQNRKTFYKCLLSFISSILLFVVLLIPEEIFPTYRIFTLNR